MDVYFLKSLRFLFHPKKDTYFALKKIIGFFPNNISFYEEALLHKSSSGTTVIPGRYKNNERLEFLGDAILNAIVADIVFYKFPNRNEGFLTNTRSKIVKREMMDKIACELGLNKLVVSSSGLLLQKNHVLGNALEAFIGAIYLDRGYLKTYQFIQDRIIKKLINIDVLVQKEVNFKSKLLAWSQKRKIEMLFKVVENFTDNDHNPVFQSQVLLNGILAGIGIGYSKKESQQHAARMAFKRIRSNKDFATKVLEAAMTACTKEVEIAM
ncbi:MAG: ribonuclease III [Dysgonamonadaceae bacterium]|nr:ribonuclease III [Dysgonamonadaceae bacterium]